MEKKKSLIAISILLIICFSIKSQTTYHKFIENETKYWDVATISAISACRHEHPPLRYYIKGDTLINDTAYRKVFVYGFRGVDPVNWGCPPYYVDTVSYSTNIYIREDTISKKVYRYTFGEKDFVLFDFSLKEGDSIYNNQSQGYTIFVDSINYLTTKDSKIRKQFFISDTTIPYSFGAYTEGLGGSEGPFEFPLEFSYDIGIATICLEINGVKIIDGECYDFITAINSNLLARNKIELYPNPVGNSDLNIEINASNPEPLRIQIFDISGKKMVDFEKKEKEFKIDVSNYPAGCYFVKFSPLGGKATHKKFIKI